MDQPPAAQSPDHAQVRFHPPPLLGLFVVAGFVLEKVLPLSFVAGSTALVVGPAVCGAAVALAVWAVVTMKRAHTTVPTHTSTTTVVRNGPYKLSRNPIYLGMCLLMIGVGVWTDSAWFLILMPAFALLLTWGVILREEAYLERKFGSDFLSYKNAVRRWL